MKHKGKFLESKEGFTYLPLDKEELVSGQLLTFVNPQEQMRIRKKINAAVKSLKVDPLDKVNSEFIEVDKLL